MIDLYCVKPIDKEAFREAIGGQKHIPSRIIGRKAA